MTPLEWLGFCILVLISAFMSMSEVSLFSLSRFQIRSLKGKFEIQHRNIRKLLSDPAGLLVTILVINEVVNISLATLVAQAVSRGWGTGLGKLLWPGLPKVLLDIAVGTLLTAPIVLFFCEITPKAIGARANTILAPLVATPMSALYTALTPVRFILKRVTQGVTRLISRGKAPVDEKDRNMLREEEFLTLVEEGHKEGAIHESELDLIRNVFELDDCPVSEIMTPLSRVFSVSSAMKVQDAVLAARTWKFSRIPVMQAGNRKRLVGVLYRKDLLLLRLDSGLSPDATVEAVMRQPVILASHSKLNVAFRSLRSSQTHIAVIEDRNHNALGIATMHDVLDELFDDLFEDAREEA